MSVTTSTMAPEPEDEHGDKPFVVLPAAWAIAGVCAWASIIITTVQIYKHLKHYNNPRHQKWIVRILFMVPIYSFFSWLSLGYYDNTHMILYLDCLRNVYEAFVIYVFVTLCFEYLGGESAILAKCNGRMNAPMCYTCTCCLQPFPYGLQFLNFIRQCCLQFCIVKPLMAVVTLATVATDHYEDGNFSPDNAYLYVSIIYNISLGFALSALLLFYAATTDLLAPYKPKLKFFTVKAVIFFAFWQGFGLMIAVNLGMIKGQGGVEASEIAMAYQNFIICGEMVLASVGLYKGFHYSEYEEGGIHAGITPEGEDRPKSSVIKNLGNTLNPKDVIQDTVRNFSKKYKKYARSSLDGASAVDNAESDEDTDTEQDVTSVGDRKKAKKKNKKRGKAKGYAKMGLPDMENVDDEGNEIDSMA